MTLGTRSLLFGVHQFAWHPVTVALAWRKFQGCWPRGFEWLCIVVHDWGYWGQPNIDGQEGRLHPVGGSRLVRRLVKFWYRVVVGRGELEAEQRALQAYRLCLFHSRHLASMCGEKPSALCWPDKLAVMYDPKWFYLLRACLSGEIYEYLENAKTAGFKGSAAQWFDWYRAKVEKLTSRPS